MPSSAPRNGSSQPVASAKRATSSRQGRFCASRPREISPARSSTLRCLEIAGWLMANGLASSMTVASPCISRARIARRVGSAKALKVLSSSAGVMSITNRLYNILVMDNWALLSSGQKDAAAGGQPAAAGLRLQGVAGREDVTLSVVGDETAAAAFSWKLVSLLLHLRAAGPSLMTGDRTAGLPAVVSDPHKAVGGRLSGRSPSGARAAWGMA